MDRIKVLFVAGHGRSGSTLFDRIVGELPGVFSAGELRHIWQEGFIENRLCGCGEAFRDCPFWREVTTRAFGRTQADVEAVLELKRRVDRWWLSPLIASSRRPPRFERDLRAYRDVLGRVYRAIAEVSGDEVIVDSTKDVSHGYVLNTMASIDLHVVHLVRDSRATAFSWQRQKFHPAKGDYMDRYGPVKASAAWTASNALAAFFKLAAPRYRLLRYARLASEPAAVVTEIGAFVGVPATPPPVANGKVELGEAHTVAGNPVRLHRGPIEIRRDDEWRRAMTLPRKALVTALSLPLLPLGRERVARPRG